VYLQTPAANGGTAKSATLNTAWDNAAELVPVGGIAPPPVPEPSTAQLLAAGLAGMSGLRLRQRSRAR
jgi:hypothetical protein